MRTIGLDIHKRFAEAAILEAGRPLRRQRIKTTPSELKAFVETLRVDDQVVLEATSNTWILAELFRTRAGRVVVSNPMRTKAIASAKVKTDKVDAEILARLLASDFLPEVWSADPELRALRRQLAHRASLVRQRTQFRNRIHAIVIRNLLDCPYTDLFGKNGQRWLSEQPLPRDERVAVESMQRLLASLDGEIEIVEQALAEQAVKDPAVQRLITIPGVGLITALVLVAAIGDIHRFARPTQLVGYFGLDPKVRQSGDSPAWTGRISRQGNSHARAVLVEAASSVVRLPGPLRAFYQRIRARRGTQIALMAVARKLTVFAWHLLTHESNYRWVTSDQLTRKRGQLMRRAGLRDTPASTVPDGHEGPEFLLQAEEAYRALVASRRQQDAAASNGKRLVGKKPDARRSSRSQAPVFSSRSDRVPKNLTILEQPRKPKQPSYI